ISFPQNRTRFIITTFLQKCNLNCTKPKERADFETACYEEAAIRGYFSAHGTESLKPYMPGGLSMSANAYSHLENPSTKIFICLYTAFLIYLDDCFQKDVEAVTEFNERFVSSREQKGKLLDDFASLLIEVPTHFCKIASNIIITATLNLVTALLIEQEAKKLKLEKAAEKYATFTRVMSGASEAYALFAFSPEIPISVYVQALPDLMVFINNGNDILSFYKEERRGEECNRVSLLAQYRQVSKHVVLQGLADEAVAAHQRVLQMLSHHTQAYDAYVKFSIGYVQFHTALSRYRLVELGFPSPVY
ncbi:hypothetical protein M422DRAFT_188608, partial [Sphaerobolus stellatus SS14]